MSFRISVSASASVVLPLECERETEFSNGQVKTSCVTDKDVLLTGGPATQASLTPYSISDPSPAADGCTVSSIFDPRWSFSAFEVDSNAASNASATVAFNIRIVGGGFGFGSPLIVSQGAVGADGWSACELGPGGEVAKSGWPVDCSLKYDAATKKLDLKADWICSDLDPHHPYVLPLSLFWKTCCFPWEGSLVS